MSISVHWGTVMRAIVVRSIVVNCAMLTLSLSGAAYGENNKPAGSLVQAFERCSGMDRSLSLAARIAGCTQVIGSGALKGQKLGMVLAQRGAWYAELRQPDAALRDLDRAIPLDPEDYRALNLRGVLLKYKKQYDRAIQDLTRAISLEPSFTIARINRGDAYRFKGEFDRAIADFSEAIDDAPDESIGYFYRGLAYLNKRDMERAVKDFDRTIAIAPTNHEAFFNRATAYARMENYDKAIQSLDSVIRLSPEQAEAYSNRGAAYEAKGQLDRAIEDYDRALKLNPKLSNAMRNRAAAIKRKNEQEGATAVETSRNIEDLRYAERLARESKLNSALLETSQKWCDSRGKKADALKLVVIGCTYVIEAPSTPPAEVVRALLGRGAALIGQGEHNEALTDFNKAVAIAPQDAMAWSERCRVRAIRNELDAALKDCAEALRLAPNHAEALQSRGFVHFKRGAFDASIADYNAAVRQNPKSAGALFGRGMAKEKKGDNAGSKADIDAALAMDDERPADKGSASSQRLEPSATKGSNPPVPPPGRSPWPAPPAAGIRP